MKRHRDAGVAESINVANVLMLLSRGGGGGGGGGEGIIDISTGRSTTSPDRVFECKTCNRRFPSFQALGGHRASHKKPRLAYDARAELSKPRAHECSVCGLEFAIGQALGGHMRRHRAAALAAAAASDGFAPVVVEKRGKKLQLWDLDLNMLPGEDELDFQRPNKTLGFDFMELTTPAVVDCFY